MIDFTPASWCEGVVDVTAEHLGMYYEPMSDLSAPRFYVAVAGAGEANALIVQFLPVDPRVSPSHAARARGTAQLVIHRVVANAPVNPYYYAIEQIARASNLYSDVHWCLLAGTDSLPLEVTIPGGAPTPGDR